jgi:acylphosphatase
MDDIHVIVSGRVQGVGFRDATAVEASRLQVHGWVRNLRSGQVEVYAHGDALALAQLAQWLEHGPVLARVSQVQAVAVDGTERQPLGEPSFHVLHTI